MTGSVVHSLVVPVYQNEENIPDLLAAVEDLAMHVTDLEAIFVVDGSPDSSPSLCWKLLFPRWISSPNC